MAACRSPTSTRPRRTYGVDAADLIFAMSRAARNTADKEEERLAPIRLHAFERAVPGIWSCINPDVRAKAVGLAFWTHPAGARRRMPVLRRAGPGGGKLL